MRRSRGWLGPPTFFALAVFAYVYAASLATFLLVPCNNEFAATAKDPRCRTPVYYEYAGLLCLLVASIWLVYIVFRKKG